MAPLQSELKSGSPSGSVSSVEESNAAKTKTQTETRETEALEPPEDNNGSDESVHVLDAAKTKTRTELKTELQNWSASSDKRTETEREYKFYKPSDWKCIVCKDAINCNPVYQCQMGHLACHSCFQGGRNCRSCSKAVSRIKNLAVENVMDSLVVTCKFANLGCKEVTKFKELKMSEHEDECSFATMVCPMPGCKQAGVKNLLSEHLLSKHNISSVVDVKHRSDYGYRYSDSDYRYADYDLMSCSEKFDLDSSATLVMLRHVVSKEFHLLHQESTTLGHTRLHVTSLAKTNKRK